MSELIVPIKTLSHAQDLEVPAYATEDSAGIDLCAAIPDHKDMRAGERELIPTGIKIALPKGYEAQIRPRSGLALNHGVTVLNTPGTIDADYRGEVKVLLVNHGQDLFLVTRGMRIAQMVIAPVARAQLNPVEDLDDTARGDGGFGSTGTEG